MKTHDVRGRRYALVFLRLRNPNAGRQHSGHGMSMCRKVPLAAGAWRYYAQLPDRARFRREPGTLSPCTDTHDSIGMIALPVFIRVWIRHFALIARICRRYKELAAAGCTLLQYRNKSATPARCSNRRANSGRASAPSVKLIMNDRADLCLAADFDGLHVGQDDLSPESARRIIGPDLAGWASPPTIPSSSPKPTKLPPTTSPSAPSLPPPAKPIPILSSASKASAGRGN